VLIVLSRATPEENRNVESKLDNSEPKLDTRESPIKLNSSNEDKALNKTGIKMGHKNTLKIKQYHTKFFSLLYGN